MPAHQEDVVARLNDSFPASLELSLEMTEGERGMNARMRFIEWLIIFCAVGLVAYLLLPSVYALS